MNVVNKVIDGSSQICGRAVRDMMQSAIVMLDSIIYLAINTSSIQPFATQESATIRLFCILQAGLQGIHITDAVEFTGRMHDNQIVVALILE